MTPAQELTALVVAGAAAFYWAEVGQNETVKTYWDALHYIATSLSVGYANIFPVTPLGKTIGALVMMVGPALSARALETASPAPAPNNDTSGAVVEKLDEILQQLSSV